MVFSRIKGLTLIEVMIIIAIAAIVIVGVIPKILESKKAHNEQLAIVALEKIFKGSETYKSVQSSLPASYPENLKELQKINAIDKFLASGISNGYEYTYKRIDYDHFECRAVPLKKGLTGDRTFFVNESGVVKQDNVDVLKK